MPLGETKKALQEVNQALVEKDRELIQAYIDRHELKGMAENGSGLYYLVWGQGNGTPIKNGDVVTLEYTLSLLDGTICYTSKSQKPKEFVVGYGGVESGLEMAMLLMQLGQSGKFILPPHLAHGLLGDQNKIPPRSIIVYDVRVINVVVKN